MKWLLFAAVACVVLASPAAGGTGGGRIVLVRNHLCQKWIDCGLGEIAVVNADGSGLRVLTHDKVTELSPKWSPDGREIAYIRSTAKGSSQVWLMSAEGSHRRPLTRLRAVQLYGSSAMPSLDWSPTGRQIVVAAYPPDPDNNGGPQHLYLANTRTGAFAQLTSGTSMTTNDEDPTWSPDGRWIAFRRAPSRIMLLSTATDRVHELKHRGASLDACCLAWSPDSRRLAFNESGKIHVIDADGTHLRSLGVRGDDPSWSPDGQWLTFDSDAQSENLAEIRPDGSRFHLVTHLGLKWVDIEPDWGPG